jgi:hypothetical protein
MAELIGMFRSLNAEQKAAAIGAVLLAISTFGPFSFVEAAEILVALGVLALLRARALGRRFHLPFGDGTVIAVAGIWAAALIVVRVLDRPLGQNLLALGCAAILIAAGARERAKRPPDDIPPERRTAPVARAGPATAATQPMAPSTPAAQRAADADSATEPLPPPEFEPYRPQPNEQLRLGGESAPPGEAQPPDEA